MSNPGTGRVGCLYLDIYISTQKYQHIYIYSIVVIFTTIFVKCSSFLLLFCLCLLNSWCRSPNTNTHKKTHTHTQPTNINHVHTTPTNQANIINQHQPIHPSTPLLANLVDSNLKRCTYVPLEDLTQNWSETKQINKKNTGPWDSWIQFSSLPNNKIGFGGF